MTTMLSRLVIRCQWFVIVSCTPYYAERPWHEGPGASSFQPRVPSCAVHQSGDGRYNSTMFTFIPSMNMTPMTWSAATKIPLKPLSGNCFAPDDFKISEPQELGIRGDPYDCCCAFWNVTPALEIDSLFRYGVPAAGASSS